MRSVVCSCPCARNTGENRLCEPFESNSVKGEQVEFLAEDSSIQCGKSEHTTLKIISVCLILLW